MSLWFVQFLDSVCLTLGMPGLERRFSHTLEVPILQMLFITNKVSRYWPRVLGTSAMGAVDLLSMHVVLLLEIIEYLASVGNKSHAGFLLEWG